MTDVHIESEHTERPERAVLIRQFDAVMTAGDGRTIDVRIVPYSSAATVSDGGPLYREEWLPGCFDDQLRAANRVDVLLNFEHEQGIRGIIGRGLTLVSRQDGLHGSFRIFDGADGDKAIELVREDVLGGISLEAFSKKSIRTAAGVVQRVKAHLDKVALCRRPAFAEAVVLALRQETVFDEEMIPVEMDPEVVARCRRLGIKLPQRYEAHPDETDTPPGGGTSAAGTRHTDANTTSEVEAP